MPRSRSNVDIFGTIGIDLREITKRLEAHGYTLNELTSGGNADPDWIYVTGYSNSWSGNVQYRKLDNGIVIFKEEMSGGVVGTAFTMPVGYRPDVDAQFVLAHQDVTSVPVTFKNTGAVRVEVIGGGSAVTNFAPVAYLAEG